MMINLIIRSKVLIFQKPEINFFFFDDGPSLTVCRGRGDPVYKQLQNAKGPLGRWKGKDMHYEITAR